MNDKAWPFVLILVLCGVFYAAQNHRHDVGFFEDDAIYILCARSLMTGSYSDLTQIEKPPEVHFLPGFPILLAPFTLIAGDHLNRFKWIPWLLAMISAFLTSLLFYRWFPNRWAAAGLAIFAFNPLPLLVSDILLSEWWLLCLVLLSLVLIADLEEHSLDSFRKSALAAALSWAAITRPEGLLLSAALLAGLMMKRPSDWRTYRWVLPWPFCVFVGWLIRNFLVSGQISTYAAIWQPPTWIHIGRALYHLAGSAIGLVSFNHDPHEWIQAGIGMALLLAGFSKNIRFQTFPVSRFIGIVFLALFTLVRFVWHVEAARFFLPVLPLLVAWTVQGGINLIRIPRLRLPGVVLSMSAVIFLILHTATAARATLGSFDRLPSHTLAFISDQIPRNATVLSNKGGMMALYTGRFSSGDVNAETPEEFAYRLMITKTSYVWITRQPIADLHVQEQWKRINRWASSWSHAFSVAFDDPDERSTIYSITLPKNYVDAYQHYWSARQALVQGDERRTMDNFQAAFRLYPDLPGALNDYASLLIDRGDTARAETSLLKALRLRPHFALAMINLARLNTLQSRPKRAREWLLLAQKSAQMDQDPVLQETVQALLSQSKR